MQWWCQRGTPARCFAALVACVVLGINAFYLPAHVIADHHGHQTAVEHDHDHTDVAESPHHDEFDHFLPSALPVALVWAGVPNAVAVAILCPTPLRVNWLDPQWYPQITDSDRSPPGPSRAPPV